MPTMKVKAVEGRIAREDPHGPFIPHDRYVPVEMTNYTMRLLNHHGDIVLEPVTPPKPKPVEVKPSAENNPKEKN